MQKIKSIRQLTKLFNKVPFIDSWFKRKTLSHRKIIRETGIQKNKNWFEPSLKGNIL